MRFVELICVIILTKTVAGIEIFLAPKNCHDGYRLQEPDSYITINVTTPDECIAQCARDGPKCDSVSWRAPVALEKEGDCALNWGRTDVFWSGIEKTAGWKYYEKKHDTIQWESCRPFHITNCETARRSGQPMNEFYLIYLGSWAEKLNPSTVNRQVLKARCEYSAGRGWIVTQKHVGVTNVFHATYKEYMWGVSDNTSYFSGLQYWEMLTTMHTHWRIAEKYLTLEQTEVAGALGNEKKYTVHVTTTDTTSIGFDVKQPDGKLRVLQLTSCLTSDVTTGELTLGSCHDPSLPYFVRNEDSHSFESIGANLDGDYCLRATGTTAGSVIMADRCGINSVLQLVTGDTDGQRRSHRFRYEATKTDTEEIFYQDYPFSYMKDDMWYNNLSADTIDSNVATANSWFTIVKGKPFSTWDKDQDTLKDVNKAMTARGGWWHTADTKYITVLNAGSTPLMGTDCQFRTEDQCVKESRIMWTLEARMGSFLPLPLAKDPYI